MQVTTPKGRWLVPPDRAVWVPARLEHSIDVLADIEMRTLYFDLAWLAREHRSESLDAEFVVRVSRLLHESILALFDGRDNPDRTELLVRLAVLELHHAEDSATFIPLPHEPRCRRAADIVLGDPTGRMRSRRWRARSAPRRGRCRGCSHRRRNSASRAGASARASRRRSKNCRWSQVSVKQLASDLGYASVPAFSHAFRQVTGKTPTEFAGRNEADSAVTSFAVPERRHYPRKRVIQ